MNRIIKFVFFDIIRNKIILGYTLLLGILSWGVFGIEDNITKGLLTILNVILLTVPLVSIIFSTIYIYNSSEFIELLISQPVKRKRIWLSLFNGLSISLILAFLAGAGIPILFYAPLRIGIMITLSGCLITAVFTAIAFLSSVSTRDKARGIGVSILLWLYFALLFDGLVLFILFQLADYPIEQAMIGVSMLSPVDLARILILLQMDVSAMLGYTGAVFKEFFGSGIGVVMASVFLLLWIAIPFSLSLRKFSRKDL